METVNFKKISQCQEVNQLLINKVRTDCISIEMVFKTYSKRGPMELYIKEAKNGFYFDKT